MKNTTKRTLSLILIVCMLLSVIPFASYANQQTYTYNIAQLNTMVGTSVSAFNAPSAKPNTTTPEYIRYTVQAASNNYFGLLFEDIAAGTYTMTMNLLNAPKGAVNVAVISKTEYDAIPGAAGMIAQPDPNVVSKCTANKAGAIAKDEKTPAIDVTLSGDAGNDYYIFFVPEIGTKWFMDITNITLTPRAATPGGSGDGEGEGEVGYVPEAGNKSWTAAEFFAATSQLVEGSEDLKEIYANYFSYNGGYTTKYADPSNASYAGAGNEYLAYTLNNKADTTGQSFVSTKFTTVGAGTYTMTFDIKNWGATTTVNIHVFSEDDFADCTNTSSRITKATELIAAGAHKVATVETTKSTDTDLSFTAELPASPIICLAGPATDGIKNQIQFTKVSFTTATITPPEVLTPGNNTYDYNKLYEMYVAGGSVNNAGNVKVVAESAYLQKQFSKDSPDSYFGILFEDVASATYTLKINHTDGRIAANVYVVPKADIDAILNSSLNTSGKTEAIIAKLNSETLAGTLPVGSSGNASIAINATFSGDAGDDYYVFLKNCEANGADKKLLRLTSIAKLYDESSSSGYGYVDGVEVATEADVVAALSEAGKAVKLLKNINVGDSAVLGEGTTLDLNGKAVTGTIDTTQGTVIDSKDGKGSISVKPAKLADGKVALKDGSNYRIFGYSVKTVESAKANADKSGAFFWYRVSFSNKSAYALAAADADFSIGAKLTVGDKSATVQFDAALISALAKSTGKYFVLCLEGLNSDAIAAGTVLTVTPVVNGVESGASISYTK